MRMGMQEDKGVILAAMSDVSCLELVPRTLQNQGLGGCGGARPCLDARSVSLEASRRKAPRRKGRIDKMLYNIRQTSG